MVAWRGMGARVKRAIEVDSSFGGVVVVVVVVVRT